MLKIRPMRVEDYSFAVELTNTMDWNMANEDFEFMTSLEPQGCLVAYDDAERVGIATCISYGDTGWFGNLIVKEEYRKHGIGNLLVQHAVKYLQVKGVQTVGLYAYPNLVPFYSKLGFKYDEDFSVLKAQNPKVTTAKAVPLIGQRQMDEITRFDGACFRGDRTRLLQSIIGNGSNLGYFITMCGETVGYVAATVYEKMAWVGPLICQNSNPEEAISLVQAVLAELGGKTVYAVVPRKRSPLHDTFRATGFSEDFYVSRMFLGSSVAKNCIYLAESLERG